jgi:hypothetical protein
LAHIEREAIRRFDSFDVPVVLLVNKCDLADDAESIEEVRQLVRAFVAMDCATQIPTFLCSFNEESVSIKNCLDIKAVVDQVRRSVAMRSATHEVVSMPSWDASTNYDPYGILRQRNSQWEYSSRNSYPIIDLNEHQNNGVEGVADSSSACKPVVTNRKGTGKDRQLSKDIRAKEMANLLNPWETALLISSQSPSELKVNWQTVRNDLLKADDLSIRDAAMQQLDNLFNELMHKMSG